MDIVNVLPNPPLFFRLFLRLALSLLNSILNTNYCRYIVPDKRPPSAFDVHPRTGFFPSQPLPKLSLQFAIWEDALRVASGNLSLGEDDSEDAVAKRPFGERWRSNIVAWPTLDTQILHSDLRLSQRAHLVLAWLVNFYVHSLPPSAPGTPIRVPQTLAVPLVQISRHLGFAPVLTFADTVLWNWELINPDQPLSVDNMRFLNLFSGTDDERIFYQTSAMAELRGVEMLRIIDDYNSLPNVTDMTSISKVARDLTRLAGVIEGITEIIQSVRPVCDPHVFYWDIRPWFEGSDAKGTGFGWIYEGVENSHLLDLSGPSAGQSSVMHALDIFLDVDHKLHQRRYPAPSPENKRADHGFMERMRRYMPGQHQEYLARLSASSRSIREVAQSTLALREPYDTAILALKRLRDSHIRIACLYVVTMSRSTPGQRAGCPASAMMDRIQAAKAAGKGPVRGTGGNELSVLLKAGRDATRRAVLKPS